MRTPDRKLPSVPTVVQRAKFVEKQEYLIVMLHNVGDADVEFSCRVIMTDSLFSVFPQRRMKKGRNGHEEFSLRMEI